MNYLTKSALLFSTIGIIFLSACGGGSQSGSQEVVDEPDEPVVLSGVFIDSPVQGLSFSTPTQSGLTDENGQFSYIEGESITFSIGDINFPTVNASNILTPLNLFETSDINDTGVINMARFVQTLDQDAIPANGIEITEMAHTQSLGVMVDFLASDFEQQVENIIANSGGANLTLISEEAALTHLQSSLESLDSADCTSTHAKVGSSGEFITFFHDVAGTATIINDCTIEINLFNYDGGGPDVYFTAATNHDYLSESAFYIGDPINGTIYNNATVILTLPDNKTLDDFDSLSVWCADFSVSFGELMF